MKPFSSPRRTLHKHASGPKDHVRGPQAQFDLFQFERLDFVEPVTVSEFFFAAAASPGKSCRNRGHRNLSLEPMSSRHGWIHGVKSSVTSL
jgi:hypothetical protein